jgi:hypothetical protein
VAVVWILLLVGGLKYYGTKTDLFDPTAGGAAPPAQEAVGQQPGSKQQKSSPSSPGAGGAKSSPAGGKSPERE